MVKRTRRNLRKSATLLIVVIAGLALASGLVFGQEFSATMSGVVHDASGGLVPGVTVTAKHTESGLTRTAVTNETGSYRLPTLPVGAYEVTAELSGFKQQVRRGVNLVVTQEAVVNFTLEVGAVRGSSLSAGYHKRRSGDQRRLTRSHTPCLFRLSAPCPDRLSMPGRRNFCAMCGYWSMSPFATPAASW